MGRPDAGKGTESHALSDYPAWRGFIRYLDQELPIYTTSLIATSDFFVEYWWAVLIVIVAIPVILIALRRSSKDMAYRIDLMLLNVWIAGPLIRKISIARFAQTFGALYASGIEILKALESSRRTVNNLALSEALMGVIEQVQTGSPLSEAFNASGEFPSMVVRMLKVGEESGNLTVVLDQVSEFYTNDVDEAIQGLIAMIEPLLTVILGGMILWIAVAVFGPIYSSFENMDF
jgi:type IV pilus assembly protein PilC